MNSAAALEPEMATVSASARDSGTVQVSAREQEQE